MNSVIHLESRLNEIYDHLYANASVRTPRGIAKEVSKVFHSLSFIEKTKNRNNLTSSFHKFNKKFLSESERQLASYVFKQFTEAFQEMNSTKKLYPVNEKIELSEHDLAFVCGKLSGINILDESKDILGDAMEVFRSNWTKSHGGQFFTDQRVTGLAMTLLDFNPDKGDDLVDICSGTGGFLLAALKHIKKLFSDNEEKFKKLATSSLMGQEIDEELCDIANATLSTRIGTSDINFVKRGNSILYDDFASTSNKITFGTHKCAATNPPFGTKITIKDQDVLNHFDLAKSPLKASLFDEQNYKLTHRAPDILFVEQNVRLLKPGVGRLAIVVPYQIVSGPQTLFVREWILKNTQIMAVVDLPAETFQPHTGTKACLLVLKRRLKPLEKLDLSNDPAIFMATPKWIGHDRRGNPTYKRNIDGSFSDEILSDFPEVEVAYQSFQKGDDPSKVYEETCTILATNILSNPKLRLDARFFKTSNGVSHEELEKKEWEMVKLKDVVERIFYPGRFSRNYVETFDNSVPFLGGTNITQLLLKTEKRISTSHPKIEELKVKPGWILITRSGSTGIVSSVPAAWEDYAISEHVIRIIPNEEKLSKEYLYAFLRTRYAQGILAKGIYGSVIDEITPEYIENIKIPVPKSKALLVKIVENIKEGELARQKAIIFLESGTQTLEDVLII